MRILFLNANLAGCGTYHRALWFARICARHGHHATLCTVARDRWWTRHEWHEPRLRVSEGPRWGYTWLPGHGSNWLDIFWRWHELRTGSYDVVYAFEYHPNVAWPVYAALGPRQILLSDWCDWYAGAANVMRGNRWLHAWDRRREEHIRHCAARISVISSALADRARAIGIPPSRITLLREGVDTTTMRPCDRASAKASLGIPADTVVIGTLNDGQALPHLLSAFAAFAPRVPHARLLFIGQPPTSFLAHAARLSLSHRLVITGRCSDAALPRLLSAADICALPLEDTCVNRARFPHKIGDYLACGAAVLLTRVGDYPAMLDAAGAAYVVNSLADIPDALEHLARDAELRAHLGATGRAWVARTLDWSVLAPQILNFVEGAPTPSSP
ncbi:MAG: glycosyltransferase [bacterium]|nr:glycosyltransferase [bacterium]